MNKFLIILLFPFLLSAQTIFTEPFNNFIDRTDTAGCRLFFVLDSVWLAAYGGSDNQMIEDLSPFQNDLTIAGWTGYDNMLDSTNIVSSLYSGGLVANFDHTAKTYLYDTGNTNIAIGAGDWTLLTNYYCTNLTPAWRMHLSNFGHGTTQDQGAVFYVSATHTQDFDLTARAGPNGTPARTVNIWYFGAVTHNNTTGNIQMYINGATHSTATAMNPNITGAEVGIGHFHTNVVQDWAFEGGIEVVKVYNRLLTDKELKEFGFLAATWVSGAGGVARQIVSGRYKFHQGVAGTGLVVKTKAGGAGTGFTNTPTLTADSTRFTVQFPTFEKFDGDSIMLKTETDSVWRTISDSTLAAGYGLRVVFDAWETGGNCYVDNITISGYLIPVANESVDGKFKQNQGWDKFKGW